MDVHGVKTGEVFIVADTIALCQGYATLLIKAEIGGEVHYLNTETGLPEKVDPRHKVIVVRRRITREELAGMVSDALKGKGALLT